MAIEIRKTTEEYWQNRMVQRVLYSEELAAKMLERLKEAYSIAFEEIEKELFSFYGKYATENKITIQEAYKKLSSSQLQKIHRQINEALDSGELSNQFRGYLRILKSQVQLTRLQALQFQIQNILENLYMQEESLFAEGMTTTYKEAYLRTNFDIQQGLGYAIPFMKLNTPMINAALNQKWLGENYSSRIWKDKEKLINVISTTIPSNIILGKSPRVVGSIIAKAMNTREDYATRLARTEFINIANQATLETYNTLDFVEYYKYSAVLDSRTSDVCLSLNNKVFDKKLAQVGINYPPMHPNCRSSTIPYFKDLDNLYKNMTRLAKHPKTGKYVEVPMDFDYKQWKEKLKSVTKTEVMVS